MKNVEILVVFFKNFEYTAEKYQKTLTINVFQ